MSTSAAEVQSSTLDASQDPTDAIANMLIGEEEKEESADAETKAKAVEDKDDVEKQTVESTDDTADADDEPTWENVLGVEEGKLNFDEDGNLAGLNVKVDGQTSTVNMNDLITGYQNNKAFTQKSQALSEERKNFDEQRGVVEQQVNAKLKDVTLMNDYLEKLLVSEFEGINWDQLRAENGGEYAALRQDFAARAQDLQQLKDVAKQATDEQSLETQQKIDVATKQRISEQYGKMLENNPTWQNPQVYTKEMDALKSFCSNQYNFTADDFKLVQDARLIELIKDASLYRSGVKLANKKLDRNIPQFQKSVGKAPNKLSKLQKLTKAAGKATGSKQRDLQADAVAELLISGG